MGGAVNSAQLLPAIRDLYSRQPEYFHHEPWELAHVLFSLGYVEDLAEEKRREHLERAADLARKRYALETRAEEEIAGLLATLSELEQLDRRHRQEMRLGGTEPPNEPLAWTLEPWLLTRLGGWVRENPSHQGFVAKDLAELDGLAAAPHAGVDKEE
jgi:hypothetical protein